MESQFAQLEASSITPTPRINPYVGIVVGHWGDNNDPGAVCADGQLNELQLNQTIATRLEKYLTSESVDVILLKEFDQKLSNFQASALISLHADSCDYINDLATGYKVAAAIGSKRPERSARLASCLRSRYSQATGLPLHSTSVTPDMTSYHAFSEINSDTPAAIIETGFLNLDREYLVNNPDSIAQGVAEGILCFLRNESINPLATNEAP